MLRRTTSTAGALLLVGILGSCSSSTKSETSEVTTTTAVVVTAPPATSDETGEDETNEETDAPESSDSSAPLETTPSSTDAATTTLDTRPVDPAAQALSLAGTLQAADFPSPWTQYAAGQEEQVDTGSCSYQPGGAVTLINRGGAQSGPTMQLGDTGGYVSSFSLAFPDATTAGEYVALVNTDAWMQCRLGELQQFQVDNGSDSVVSLATRENETLHQGGFESYAEIHLADTSGNVQRVVLLSFYVVDRTVVGVTQEYGAMSDADTTTLLDSSYKALVAAYARINAI